MARLNAQLRRGQQKAQGVFLTPVNAAAMLANWAIRDPSDRVLDPAVGAGILLAEARQRLQALGARDPSAQLLGVDVDPDALRLTARAVSALGPSQLRLADFLELEPKDLGPVDAIVGNPPWIGHHALTGRRSASASRVGYAGYSAPGRSGYWAYFLLHSLNFLAHGGRLALLVPWSILQSDYSSSIRAQLARHFAEVNLIAIEKRIFASAQERVVILLAAGFGGGPADLSETRVRDLTILPSDLADIPVVARPDIVLRNSVTLGNVAKISIGTVTGANEFFVVTATRAKELGIPESFLVSCVSRRKHLRTLALRRSDLVHLQEAGERVLLFRAPTGWVGTPEFKDYVRRGEESGLDQRLKCRSRTPWYSLDSVVVPDAFVTFLGSDGPTITANEAGATCTNSYYGLTWKEPLDSTAIAVGMLSTAGELSAETTGRVLGGGALKFEPSDLARLRVPVVPVRSDVHRSIDRLLRDGSRELARQLVDALMLSTGQVSQAELKVSREQLEAMRQARTA